MKSSDSDGSCKRITEKLWDSGLWRIPGVESQPSRTWRVSTTPFVIKKGLAELVLQLGPVLNSFYAAVNALYLRENYPWVNDYLDRGKPEWVVERAHMRYQKQCLPRVIRPDIILTEDGPRITELDSVPGGVGQLDLMSLLYGECGFDIFGGARGMVNGFKELLQAAASNDDPVVAIMVSDESNDYRPEMTWLASQLRAIGCKAWIIKPEDVTFTETGLYMSPEDESLRIDVVYRFFELFDLKNIGKWELVAYAAKKKQVIVTPPYKHHLEEKMLLALVHHPMLRDFFGTELGEDNLALLKELIPATWILDPRPVPPHAVIPGFEFRGKPVTDWKVIKDGTQKERRMIVKPSGFSPLSWGSHGVVAGHDVSSIDWQAAIDNALASFKTHPYVLQRFHEGKRIEVSYFDQSTNAVKDMQGRVRLSPYYYVTGNGVKFAGALATIVSPDKKLIHGMVDAVMTPCMVAEDVREKI